MIPTTLDECYKKLDRILSDGDKGTIRTLRRENLADLHFTLGMYVRNEWRLWESDSELVRQIRKDNPLMDADEISHIILEGYWNHLKKHFNFYS